MGMVSPVPLPPPVVAPSAVSPTVPKPPPPSRPSSVIPSGAPKAAGPSAGSSPGEILSGHKQGEGTVTRGASPGQPPGESTVPRGASPSGGLLSPPPVPGAWQARAESHAVSKAPVPKPVPPKVPPLGYPMPESDPSGERAARRWSRAREQADQAIEAIAATRLAVDAAERRLEAVAESPPAAPPGTDVEPVPPPQAADRAEADVVHRLRMALHAKELMLQQYQNLLQWSLNDSWTGWETAVYQLAGAPPTPANLLRRALCCPCRGNCASLSAPSTV